MKNIFGVILFCFLCFFLYTKFFGPIPFAVNSIQTTKQDLFQVTGEGSATAVPDTATISFGVTKQGATISDAQSLTNTAIASITDGLKAQGINPKDIKTTNYSVNPNYNNAQTIDGYTVTQNIDLKVESLDKVNKVLDTLTAHGANLIGQVSFGFSDAKEQDLENQARRDAVAKAKTKAESLASASGIHLGSIINVTENTSSSIPPIRPLMAKTEDTTAPTEVTPGTNTISLSVTLSYQIY